VAVYLGILTALLLCWLFSGRQEVPFVYQAF